MKKLEHLSDEQLVDMVRSEDQELYVKIVNRYQNKLLRYALYLIRDENKAADIVQDAFIKAYINLQSFNSKRKFSSWIYRIVHNRTMDYIRKHKKEISLEKHEWNGIIKQDDTIEEDISKEEVSTMLKKSLEELPIKYRSALALFYFEEKTYEEISDVMKIPIGTVGTRITRGRKIMQKIIKKKGGNYEKN